MVRRNISQKFLALPPPPQIFQGGDLYAMSTRTFWFWWMMVDRSHAEIPGQCSALAILVLCDPKHGCYFQQVPLALPKDLLYQNESSLPLGLGNLPNFHTQGLLPKIRPNSYGKSVCTTRSATPPVVWSRSWPIEWRIHPQKNPDPHRVRGIPASSQVFCQLLFLAVPNVVLMLAAPMDEYDALP